MGNCEHPLRSNQTISYVVGDKVCNLPLSLLSCLGCTETWLIDPQNGKLVMADSEDASVLLNFWRGEADKAMNPSPIIDPHTNRPIDT